MPNTGILIILNRLLVNTMTKTPNVGRVAIQICLYEYMYENFGLKTSPSQTSTHIHIHMDIRLHSILENDTEVKSRIK